MNNSAHDQRASSDLHQSNPHRFQLHPLDQQRSSDDPAQFTLSHQNPPHLSTQSPHIPQQHHIEQQHQHQSHLDDNQPTSHHEFRYASLATSIGAAVDMKSSVLQHPSMSIASMRPYANVGAPAASSSSLHFSAISDAHQAAHSSFLNHPQQHSPLASPYNATPSMHTQSPHRATTLSAPSEAQQQHHHPHQHHQQQQQHQVSRHLLGQHTLHQPPTQHISTQTDSPPLAPQQTLLKHHQQADIHPSKSHHFHQSSQSAQYSPRSDIMPGSSSGNITSNFTRGSPQHLAVQSTTTDGVKSNVDLQHSLSSPLYEHMAKVQHASMPSMHHRYNLGTSSHVPMRSTSAKSENIPSMPLPMHPDPVQAFQPSQDVCEAEKPFPFARQGFFEDLAADDGQPPSGALPPPGPSHDSEHGNAMAGMDGSLPAHLGIGGTGMTALPAIGSSGTGGIGPSMGGYGSGGGAGSSLLGGGMSSGGGGGPTDLGEGVGDISKMGGFQRKMRPMSRTRAQQMTESQRKQRHNEHTRASRSRIDRGLERLKAVIKKVRPQQKVNKKADVLHEAVKLLKEGFHLPTTESDEERDEPQESSLSV